MFRSISRVSALLVSAVLGGTPLVVAGSTASALPINPGVAGVTINAVAPNFDITLDCGEFVSSYEGLYAAAKLGDTMTVHTVNCANYFFDVTTPYPIGNPPGYSAEMTGLAGEGTWNANYWFDANNPIAPLPSEFRITAGTFIYIDNASNTVYKPIDFHASASLPDPSGARAYSQVGYWNSSSREFTIADGAWNHYLNGLNTCRLRSGTHVYDEIPITVTASGEYTFRYLAATPESKYLFNWLDRNPSYDSFLALYTQFDPANPDANLVGCNDDINGELSYADRDYTTFVDSSGNILSNLYSQFVSNLTPGNYTLVMTQYDQRTTSEWVSTPYADSSGTFEMWGPSGGFSIPEYSITFDSRGGSPVDPVTANLAVPLDLPSPTRAGYRFDGWFTSADGGDQAPNGTFMPGPTDVTLFAHWSVDNSAATDANLAATGLTGAGSMIFAVFAISASVGIVVYRRRSRI